MPTAIIRGNMLYIILAQYNGDHFKFVLIKDFPNCSSYHYQNISG